MQLLEVLKLEATMLRNCQNPPTRTLMFYFLEKTASKGRLYNILGQAPGSGNKKVIDGHSTLDFYTFLPTGTASSVFLSWPRTLGKITNKHAIWYESRIHKYLHIQKKNVGLWVEIISFKMAAVSWFVYAWSLGLCCFIPGWFNEEKIRLEILISPLSYDAYKRSKKVEQTQV